MERLSLPGVDGGGFGLQRPEGEQVSLGSQHASRQSL